MVIGITHQNDKYRYSELQLEKKTMSGCLVCICNNIICGKSTLSKRDEKSN